MPPPLLPMPAGTHAYGKKFSRGRVGMRVRTSADGWGGGRLLFPGSSRTANRVEWTTPLNQLNTLCDACTVLLVSYHHHHHHHHRVPLQKTWHRMQRTSQPAQQTRKAFCYAWNEYVYSPMKAAHTHTHRHKSI